MLPNPVFCPAEVHGQRSLVGCSPQGCKELDTTQRLSLTHSRFYRCLSNKGEAENNFQVNEHLRALQRPSRHSLPILVNENPRELGNPFRP